MITDRPEHLNTWRYLNKNEVMYVPQGKITIFLCNIFIYIVTVIFCVNEGYNLRELYGMICIIKPALHDGTQPLLLFLSSFHLFYETLKGLEAWM